jgi:Nucleoside-diphosphate-sugar pyrophosphorylase involved in lipopolysaccharide biosynthesis/translation initiation factor 2B, gamma/epsilon subunits (eIF-2Bgamma/eIF-2Bepsilon)
VSGRIGQRAMVLAAGLGLRMRPLTERMPKPLVPVCGRPLIDWGLDALQRAGVAEAVVNVHHLPDMLIAHLTARSSPRIIISDERDRLLDSGGALVKALPHLGTEAPFFVLNADTLWIDRNESNLCRLRLAWDEAAMDILLLLADPAAATGHTGKMDFIMGPGGRLRRAGSSREGFIYAGAALFHPGLLEGAAAEPHSLNLYFDRAIAAGRLYGLPLEGHWITVGTPDAIAPAEAELRRLGAAP